MGHVLVTCRDIIACIFNVPGVLQRIRTFSPYFKPTGFSRWLFSPHEHVKAEWAVKCAALKAKIDDEQNKAYKCFLNV